MKSDLYQPNLHGTQNGLIDDRRCGLGIGLRFSNRFTRFVTRLNHGRFVITLLVGGGLEQGVNFVCEVECFVGAFLFFLSHIQRDIWSEIFSSDTYSDGTGDSLHGLAESFLRGHVCENEDGRLWSGIHEQPFANILATRVAQIEDDSGCLLTHGNIVGHLSHPHVDKAATEISLKSRSVDQRREKDADNAD